MNTHVQVFVRMYVSIPNLFCIIILGIKPSEEELQFGV